MIVLYFIANLTSENPYLVSIIQEIFISFPCNIKFIIILWYDSFDKILQKEYV